MDITQRLRQYVEKREQEDNGGMPDTVLCREALAELERYEAHADRVLLALKDAREAQRVCEEITNRFERFAADNKEMAMSAARLLGQIQDIASSRS
jgi:hypothetical protein